MVNLHNHDDDEKYDEVVNFNCHHDHNYHNYDGDDDCDEKYDDEVDEVDQRSGALVSELGPLYCPQTPLILGKIKNVKRKNAWS